MEPVLHNPCVAHIRLVLAIFTTVCFIIMAGVAFNPFYHLTPDRKIYKNYSCMPGVWELAMVPPENPDYSYHITAIMCEWATCFAYMIYFMTYAVELRHAVLFQPKVLLPIG